MQTHFRGMPHWLSLGILLLTLSACATTVTRVPLEEPHRSQRTLERY